MCVCMYVCMYAYAYVSLNTNVSCTPIRTAAVLMYVCVCTHTHTHTHTVSFARVMHLQHLHNSYPIHRLYTIPCIHTYIHRNIHKCTHKQTRAFAHTQIHTHIHTWAATASALRMSYTFGSNSQSSFIENTPAKDKSFTTSYSEVSLNPASTAYPFFTPSPADVPVFCDVFPNKLVRTLVCIVNANTFYTSHACCKHLQTYLKCVLCTQTTYKHTLNACCVHKAHTNIPSQMRLWVKVNMKIPRQKSVLVRVCIANAHTPQTIDACVCMQSEYKDPPRYKYP
jgi:hypothetical protein